MYEQETEFDKCEDFIEKECLVGSRTEGQKIMVFSHYSKYDGHVKDDRLNEKGSVVFVNGMRYVGNFENGKPNGYGTLITANGLRYEGTWKMEPWKIE